ncbi:hypothetical protein ACWGN9_04510 [Streptomyces sp. NPDC055775]|uniref:hypothetical protein n=1 Tax=unclassified Streptomyces TaxID=2593676 RepID=UPI002ED41847|nr:hypothetical protein OHB17_00105 [Streptomyces sp. NBC_00724]WTI92147.1 hypothetical protein OHB17_41900 [Streptomyces sp. NBC_00724]
MGRLYYRADSEDGDRIDDPSEDALFMMISDLNNSANSFLVVQPDEEAPVWFASVAVLDGGGYEVVRRDTTRNEHDVTTSTSIEDIAYDLTIWLTARHFPGRPTRQSTNF